MGAERMLLGLIALYGLSVAAVVVEPHAPVPATVELAAAIAIFVRGRSLTGTERTAWIAIAIGIGCWAVGDFLYWWLTYPQGQSTLYPPAVDVIYAGFYVGAGIGVVLLLDRPRSRSALPAVVWAFALATVWSWLAFSLVSGDQGGVSEDIATFTYPVLDLALAAGIGLAILEDNGRPRRALLVLTAAFLTTALADSLLVADTPYDIVPAAFIDGLWPLATILAAIAAWTPGRVSLPRQLEKGGVWLMTAIAVISLTVLVWDHFSRVPSWTALLAGLTLLIAMVSAVRLSGRYDHVQREAGAAQRDLVLRSQLIDQVDAAVIATDRDGRYTFWSQGAERLLGWSREQALGTAPGELGSILPKDEKRFDRIRGRARQGETISVECEFRRAVGSTFDCLYGMSPLVDSSGEIAGTAGVVIDLTEKKAAERTLTRRANQQEAVAELGRRVAVERDVDRLAELTCATVARVVGVDKVRLLELHTSHAEFSIRAAVGWDRGELENSVIPVAGSLAGAALAQDRPVQVREFAGAATPIGSGLPGDADIVDGVAVAIRSPDRNLGVIGAHSRVPRVFNHDELNFLQSVAGVLAAAISRERADHLGDQLQQAQKLEDVGHLAGGIAHDFNNLLALILNYVAFTRDRLPAGQDREDLDQALQATRSAADLTSRLLLLSRRDAREPRVLDLNEAIGEMVALLSRTLGEHISLTTELDPGNPAVEIDPSEIQQVLLNLAVNARDVMPGGGTLAIETTTLSLEAGDERWPLLATGDYVCLNISDSGPGMTEETRERAFDPLFTTKGAGEGTGLGLGIVHSIASRAGGTASIASGRGEGTIVSVMLPVHPGPVPEPELEERLPQAHGGGRTILLVEDEPGLRRLVEHILRSAGYTPVVAATPSEALDRARQMNGELALMLTDLVMPEMSGTELAKRVTESCPGAAVAFMSGYPGETLQGNPDGLKGAFIQKPFKAEDLIALVEQVLSRS